MMCLRRLFLVLMICPGVARRRMHTNDSHNGAQQQSNTLTTELGVSAESLEALIPGSGLVRPVGPQIPQPWRQSASHGASEVVDNLGDYGIVSQPQRSATPVMQFGGNLFRSADPGKSKRKVTPAKRKVTLAKTGKSKRKVTPAKTRATKSQKAVVRDPASLPVLGAPLAGLLAIILAGSQVNPDVVPDTPPQVAATAQAAAKDVGASAPAAALPAPQPAPKLDKGFEAAQTAPAEKGTAEPAARQQEVAKTRSLRRVLGPLGYGTRSSLEADGGSIYALPGSGLAAGDDTVGKAKEAEAALANQANFEASKAAEAERRAANLEKAKAAGQARLARMEKARAERNRAR